MKPKLRAKIMPDMFSGSARLIPVILLVAAFILLDLFLSAGKNVNADAAGSNSSSKTSYDDDDSFVNTDINEYPVTETEQIILKGIEIHIKKFTFSDISEDAEALTEVYDPGFTVVTEMIHLDADTCEATVIEELSSDDFDIAYIPYRETIAAVKSNNLYKAFELGEDRCLLSFDDENIGIISKSYPAAGLFYNKRIIEEAGLEDPMALLERGDWDLEHFYDYLEETTADNDSDGINDVFGIVINEDLTDNLAAANGVQILSVNGDGDLNLDIFTPEFDVILDFINAIYSSGFKGGMSKQGFIDGRGCFYNDDASVYFELDDVMDDEIGFICYPSDQGLIRSASANVEVAVINRSKVIDERFIKILTIISTPETTAEEYFSGIFDNEAVVAMCTLMTQNNYISPLYMFKELHNTYLDMLRDIKAGISTTETNETFGQTITESSGG
jgi:hypothetical protein